jgi:uncharacterized protein DUF3846
MSLSGCKANLKKVVCGMEDNVQKFWSQFAKKYREAVNEEMNKEEELLQLAAQVVEQAEKNAAEDPRTDEVLVLIVEPNKIPYTKVIQNDLDAMKEIVGGWIEHISIAERPNGSRIGIILNEEGKLIGLPDNRVIVGRNGAADMFVGTFFITAHNLEGDTVSLTIEEAAKYKKMFSKPVVQF